MPSRYTARAVLVLTGASVALPLPAGQLLPEHGAVDPLLVERIDGPIAIGSFTEHPAWNSVDPLPVRMHVPTFEGEPSERTEFRVVHDGQYLYFACWSFFSDATRIQDFSLERNQVGWDSDNCGIFLDTLNDEENALVFMTWPSGNRTDFALTNDAQAPMNTDWNSFWDVVVTRDERGWFAEFRIPFSSLLLQSEGGAVTMGLSASRNLSWNNERITHPSVPPGFGVFSFARPSQMRKIILEGVERERPLYVTPYSLAGGGYTHALNGAQTAYERETDHVGEVGLDLKYGFTSNLTLDLTVNTDFAQIEADDQQVNLSRFSLFFPEKRRFFQERTANFDFSLGGQDRLFHSRRIGLAQGQPVRIYGGARLVGRVGEWDVGILNMQTGESEFLPSENQGVVRLRRRVINTNSYVGGIVTTRFGSGGEYNVLYGADGIVRISERDYVTLNWAQSFDDRVGDEGEGSPGQLDRALFRLHWERRGEDQLSYSLDLARSGEAFEPGLGFLRRRDFTKLEADLGYGWRPGPESPLLRYNASVEGAGIRRNGDGTLETLEAGLRTVLETKGSHQWTLTIPFRRENLDRGFSLPSSTEVPGGVHTFVQGRLQYRAPPRWVLRPNVTVEGGQFFDGRQLSLSLGPNWSPSMHLRVSGNYRVDHVRFSQRDQQFTAHVARLRTEVMFSNALSAAAFVQYNSAESVVVANVRFHYNPREGNDLYIVWTEGLVTDRFDFDPVRPGSSERTILLKYSHTLTFGF
jgi:hypothetical protein